MNGIGEVRRDLGYAYGILRRRPFQVLLQVTNRCNMKCPFCDFWPNGVPPRDELSLADYGRLEAELSALGRFIVSIEGGEPFLRLDLADIVETFGQHHLPLLYTNGWYVEPEAAGRLFAKGLAQVGVSIDFADASKHDAKRRLAGASQRAWRAVELFRDAAPHGGKQVHVMTVLMDENLDELEPLLKQSAAARVGHCVTLLAAGFRRGEGGQLPQGKVADRLLTLFHRYPHFRIFRRYLTLMDSFLGDKKDLPACRAGVQSFNVDHVGNVSPCIEKIDLVVGNLRKESLTTIHARMSALHEVAGCQDCWTACRGYGQLLGDGGERSALWDLATRMRSA